MRRWYYTLLVLMIFEASILGFRWFQTRPVPVRVLESAAFRWHLVDPGAALKSGLPIPSAARPVIRSIHVAGTSEGAVLIEAQTRLPGWMLRRMPVAGFTHRRSSWDVCLVREGLSGPLTEMPDPVRRVPDSVSAWLSGDPPVHLVLLGSNPFQFASYCPGATEEAMLEGPSEGATLFLAAGRSPHLARFLPGVTPERIEAGPDWADAVVVDDGRRRSARWGAPAGPPGEARRLSLRLRYRADAGGLPGLLRQILPKNTLPSLVKEVEAECRAAKGGERCEGRLILMIR